MDTDAVVRLLREVELMMAFAAVGKDERSTDTTTTARCSTFDRGSDESLLSVPTVGAAGVSGPATHSRRTRA
jgi:hypothetical protein